MLEKYFLENKIKTSKEWHDNHFRKKTKQESRGLSMAQNVILQIPAILEHHGIELTINIQYFIFIYVDP